MNKTSGFRTIEFKEIECTYSVFNEYSTPFFVKCENGTLYDGKSIISFNCPKCNGTGKLEIVESKVE